VSLANVRVVLVRPHYPGNIGSTARAMKNFGLRELVLVAPVADPWCAEAKKLAAQGEELLHSARVVSDLPSAVADCVAIAGTSVRTGGLIRSSGAVSPDAGLAELVRLQAAGPAALVFGPEPTGLSNAEAMVCRWLLHIPADAAYPVLNLAQAVTICLYELRRQWLALTPTEPREPPAPAALLEAALGKLQTGLSAIHFLYGDKAEPLMHALRQLLRRAEPTEQEAKLLFGLARQLHWSAAQQRG
jgi:tRNA/rRNA methyltransferase